MDLVSVFGRARTAANGVVASRPALSALHHTIASRVAAGTLDRPDSKGACPAGPFGNNIGYSKSWAGDPIHCLTNRDLKMPPVLRLDVDCSVDGLRSLFWPDVYSDAITALQALLQVKPSENDTTDVRYEWASNVLELCSIALDATNIQSVFLFPAAWSTRYTWLANIAGTGGALFQQSWGVDTADACAEGSPDPAHPNSDTWLKSPGWNMPRRVSQWFSMWFNLGDASLGYPPDPVATGAAYGPLAYRGTTPTILNTRMGDGPLNVWPLVGGAGNPFAGPAIFVGSPVFDNSPMIRSFLGQHTPWDATGGIGSGVTATPAAYAIVGDWTRGEAISNAIVANLDQPMRNYIWQLMDRTKGQPAGLIAGWAGWRGNLGQHDEPAGADPRDVLVPNGQWYVDFAEQWGQALVFDHNYLEIVSNAALFYLTNHVPFMQRAYGNAFSLTPAAAAALADQLRNAMAQVAVAPSALGAALISRVNTVAGALAQIVNQVAQFGAEFYSELLSQPQLPKPLYRRGPKNLSCALDVSSSVGAAQAGAQSALAFATRPPTPAQIQALAAQRAAIAKAQSSATLKSGLQVAAVVGGLAALGAAGYYLWKK